MGFLRQRIERLPSRAFIRVAEMRGGPEGTTTDAAIEQAFSRLARNGELCRIGKGLYWKGPRGRFGMVPPTPFQAALEVAANRAPGPAGPTAAAYLGLTTQIAPLQELAVIGRESTKLRDTVFRARLNPKRDRLNLAEIAVLEIARDGLRYCDVTRDEAIAHLRSLANRGGISMENIRAAAPGEGRAVREFVASI